MRPTDENQGDALIFTGIGSLFTAIAAVLLEYTNVRDALRISQCIRPCSGSAKRGATSTITRNLVAVAPPPRSASGERLHGVMARLLEAVHRLGPALKARSIDQTQGFLRFGERGTKRSGRRFFRPRSLRTARDFRVGCSSRSVMRPSPAVRSSVPAAQCIAAIAFILAQWTSSRPNWTAAAALADATSGASTSPGFRLVRSRTTRQRRFIRPASLAGVSFLLERRGIAAILALPCPGRDRAGWRSSAVSRSNTMHFPVVLWMVVMSPTGGSPVVADVDCA